MDVNHSRCSLTNPRGTESSFPYMSISFICFLFISFTFFGYSSDLRCLYSRIYSYVAAFIKYISFPNASSIFYDFAFCSSSSLTCSTFVPDEKIDLKVVLPEFNFSISSFVSLRFPSSFDFCSKFYGKNTLYFLAAVNCFDEGSHFP